MTSRSAFTRPRPPRAACILITAGALAFPGIAGAATVTHPARPHKPSKHTSKGRHPVRRKTRAPTPLTAAQIEALIKKNEKPGPPGATGPAGANGAAGGFSASQPAGGITLSGSPTTVVSKALPAGIFLVRAKAVLSATSGTAGNALAQCDLLQNTSVIDSALWTQPLAQLLSTVFSAATTLPAQAGVSSASPTTVSLQCYSVGPSVPLTATNGQLQAVQVATAG